MLLLILGVLAGYSFPLGWDLLLPSWASITWKGAGVGLLAIWASRQGRSMDHRLLAAVLALGAIADMVLEVHFVAGAAIFAIGHVVAVILYRRHQKAGPLQRHRMGAKLFGSGLVPSALFIAGAAALSFHLAGARWGPAVAVYSLFLAAMVAAVLGSRFRLAAAGALLFLVSDLLIFARLNSLSGVGWIDHAIWLGYFSGQLLIAWGVASGLARGSLDFRRLSH